MMTIAGISDDKVGITTIFDFRYYSWSTESESLVLHCFKYASSGDRQCITLGESF